MLQKEIKTLSGAKAAVLHVGNERSETTRSAPERPTNYMDGLGFGPSIYDELGRYAKYGRFRIRGERPTQQGR